MPGKDWKRWARQTCNRGCHEGREVPMMANIVLDFEANPDSDIDEIVLSDADME